MHKLPYCRLRYNNVLYQAVFDFIHNTFPFKKINWLSKVVACYLFIAQKNFLNQTLTLCINILELGYSCNVWIR